MVRNEDVQDWLNFNQQQQPNVTVPTRHLETWKKLPNGWVKCNYDVSHHTNDQDSGMGWIIRNSTLGNVEMCGMGRFEGRDTVEEEECSAHCIHMLVPLQIHI